MKDASLQALLTRCKRGDSEAQRALFQDAYPRLLQICSRYARDRPEAQDMLQEAFLVIFRDLPQYNGTGSFDGWMHRVTVRTAIRYLRRKHPLRFADELTPDALNICQIIHPDQELGGEALLQMVRQLPPGYRSIFNMHCMEEWSYPEIAAELSIAEASVRSQYARACKQLRKMVERHLYQTTVWLLVIHSLYQPFNPASNQPFHHHTTTIYHE